MEIKHTVEILTKDIQEIEKLVRNLNNSPAPPRIELDLALSKLRNVYELLSMIREDTELEQKPVQSEIPVTESKKEEEEIVLPEEEVVVEAPAPPLKEEKPTPSPEPVAKKKEAEILAEKFDHDTSINENIASASKTADITSKISGQPIDNIGRNVGINDRFLIIRELFEGNNDNYQHLIKQLDSSTSAEEALGLLEMKFPEAVEHEAFQLLSQLAKRKFITD